MKSRPIFQPPKWCETYSFIIDICIDGIHTTSIVDTEKGLLKFLSEHYSEDLYSLSVDVLCCGHNQGPRDQSSRRQIKNLWKIDFTASSLPN